MIQFPNPNFRITEESRLRLDAAVRADVRGETQPMQRGERKRLSEQLAMQAVMALLEPVRGILTVEDANERQRNMPGYDIVVGNRLRLQVKGGTFVESIGWTQGSSQDAADLDYDLLVLVDMGAMLDGRIGRLAKYDIPIKGAVDFYIVPNDIVRGWVAKPRYMNGKGVQLYFYKRPLKPGTKEELGQCRELADYRNRFDILAMTIQRLQHKKTEISS